MEGIPTEGPQTQDRPAAKKPSAKLLLIGVIVAVFAGLLIGKAVLPWQVPEAASSASKSLTSARNDATADYEAALGSGKPIYVLFHSLS